MHFIIIGSTRCGTTSLYNYLGSHPDIALARGKGRREVHFFDYKHHYEQGIDWYRSQFKSGQVTGETSPTMLQHWLAPERLRRYMPDCRLIVLLRNPIDRAYSNYHLAKRKGRATRSFERMTHEENQHLAWELETPRFWQDHFYLSEHHLCGFLERGMYAKHLNHWFESFPREQFLIIKSEAFFTRPDVVVRTAWDWLEVKLWTMPIFKQWQKAQYPSMQPKTRIRLEKHFEQPNAELKEITGWTW